MSPVGLGDVVPELEFTLVGLLRNVPVGAERSVWESHEGDFDGAVDDVVPILVPN